MSFLQRLWRAGASSRVAVWAGAGVIAAVAAVLLVQGPHDSPDTASPRISSGPVTPAPLPSDGPSVQAQEEEGPQDDVDAPPAPAPNALVLHDGNTDLSFARRAGLHRAPNPLLLTASAALAVDVRSGRVLYERNAAAQLPIASLTKLLAGIVLLESGVSLRASLRITADDVDTLRHSRSRVPVGTRLSRAEALRLALMSSENRAAHALARTYPGGLTAFVSAMNLKARALGMTDSTFADPTGLSNRNRASARDIAKLAAAAARHPRLRQYSTTRSWRASFAGKPRYVNSNRLVRSKGWPVRLQKTGYIVEAGQCLTMVMNLRGRTVALVLLDSGSATHRRDDARKLRRWLERQNAAR